MAVCLFICPRLIWSILFNLVIGQTETDLYEANIWCKIVQNNVVKSLGPHSSNSQQIALSVGLVKFYPVWVKQACCFWKSHMYFMVQEHIFKILMFDFESEYILFPAYFWISLWLNRHGGNVNIQFSRETSILIRILFHGFIWHF